MTEPVPDTPITAAVSRFNSPVMALVKAKGRPDVPRQAWAVIPEEQQVVTYTETRSTARGRMSGA